MNHFINRDFELDRFIQFVEQGQQPTLILVSGAKQTGKTSLLHKFEDKCKELEIPCAYLHLASRRPVESIVEKMIDGLVCSLTVGLEHVRDIREELRCITTQSAGHNARPVTLSEQIQLPPLREILVEHFDDSELRTLCFDLKVDHDNLQGEGKENKARELIAYLKRRDRLSDLLEIGKQQRPSAPWENVAQESETLAEHFDYSYKRSLAENFQDSLQRLQASRLVILFDNYDRANIKVKRWIENAFLDWIQRDIRIVIVIATEDDEEFKFVDETGFDPVWDGTVRRFPLGPITNIDAWIELADAMSIPSRAESVIRYLYHCYNGDPKEISDGLKRLERFYLEGLL